MLKELNLGEFAAKPASAKYSPGDSLNKSFSRKLRSSYSFTNHLFPNDTPFSLGKKLFANALKQENRDAVPGLFFSDKSNRVRLSCNFTSLTANSTRF